MKLRIYPERREGSGAPGAVECLRLQMLCFAQHEFWLCPGVKLRIYPERREGSGAHGAVECLRLQMLRFAQHEFWLCPGMKLLVHPLQSRPRDVRVNLCGRN